jgi:hypothetical protein
MDSKRNIVQTATFCEEPVFITEDGNSQTYIKKEITGPHKALSACLHLVFQHTADVYTTMIEIIAEKYGHSSEEMLSAVMEDERFKNIMLNPVLKGLDYFKKEDLAKAIPSGDVDQLAEKVAEVKLSEEPGKKKRVLKLKKTPSTSS